MAFPLAIVFLVAVFVATYLLIIQVRRPSRYLGRIFTTIMNSSHSDLTDWGLSFVKIDPSFTILDIGCGGGRTVRHLAARAPYGHIYGVDPGKGSVAASRSYNRELLGDRVHIDEGSVSTLPYADKFFDLVTAIETQYYWPDPVNDLQEVMRVLKPGGHLVVILENYRGGGAEWAQAPGRFLLQYHTYSPEEHREMFTAAGFVRLEAHEHNTKGWLTITGVAE